MLENEGSSGGGRQRPRSNALWCCALQGNHVTFHKAIEGRGRERGVERARERERQEEEGRGRGFKRRKSGLQRTEREVKERVLVASNLA